MRKVAGCVFCDGTQVFIYKKEDGSYILIAGTGEEESKVVKEYRDIETALRDFERMVVEMRRKQQRGGCRAGI